MTEADKKFHCANCKKTFPLSERSPLDSFARKTLFFTLNQILPQFNKSNDICKGCTRQVYVWFIFLFLIVILSPYLNEMRSGAG